MAEQPPPGIQLGVAFSIQETDTGGTAIGIHWDLPSAAIVIGVSVEYAKLLAENFGRQLLETISLIEGTDKALVVAPASTLHILKGDK